MAKHGAPTDLATTIAGIAYDSPLAVVVGAQIVAKEGVHPELFRSNEAFRSTVLKRYEQVIAEDIATGKDQDRVHAMLRVLALIGESKSDDEIAATLNVTASTVQSRRRDIMRKLDIHSTPKLIHYAIMHGVTRPDKLAAVRVDLNVTS